MSREPKPIERIITIATLALLVIGCLIVVWPFLTAVLWAIILTFATWPVYRRMVAFTGGRRTLAAALMTVMITVILLIPFVILGFTLADNVRDATVASRGWLEAGPHTASAWVYRIPFFGQTIATYWEKIAVDSQSLFTAVGQWVEPASAILLGGALKVGHGIVDLAVSIFVAFFLYRDGVGVAYRALRISRRIAGDRGEHLLRLAGSTVRSVVHGILGTALVQSLVAGIGYRIAGVPGVALLTLITFFLAVTPVGPPMVYIPAALWLFSRGSTGWAIFLIVWGVIVSCIDNVLKPWLISHGSAMPFLLIFFGVIGGALGFGFVGIFLGPTLLAVGYRLLQEWAGPIDGGATLEPVV